MVKCDKWKTGCYKCPQYRDYPQSYVDRSKTMYKLKKKWLHEDKFYTGHYEAKTA